MRNDDPVNTSPWIAIVDDDPSVRSALARVLSTTGIGVETFGTAHDYLAAAAGREPVCLVLDVHLGGMTGFDLHDRLLASGSQVSVVFITAHDEVTSEELERRAGLIAEDLHSRNGLHALRVERVPHPDRREEVAR